MTTDALEKFGPAEDTGPSVREKDGGWWWADESWGWHGPYDSEKSARGRQSLYTIYVVVGVWPTISPLKPLLTWTAERERERENVVHPCTMWAPWLCDCAGACSCHWVDQPKPEPTPQPSEGQTLEGSVDAT